METNTSTEHIENAGSTVKAFGMFFLGWLVPGLGHIAQKRYLKGVVFFTGILLLSVFGVIMQGKYYDTSQLHPLMLLGFVGDVGSGLFYLIIKALGFGKGNIEAITYNYGIAYLVCAGLLNYLVALNAFDIAKGRRK